MPVIAVTDDELQVLIDALDSHVYWQLSDVEYRSSGYVMEPGSDKPETAAMITEAEALKEKLAGLVPPEGRS